MLKIYSAEGCPFAHRSRALLSHLGVPFELHEIDLANRDSEFLKLSPTGRVPLLADGDFVLYESQIINAYLAEVHGWERAFANNPRLRVGVSGRARKAVRACRAVNASDILPLSLRVVEYRRRNFHFDVFTVRHCSDHRLAHAPVTAGNKPQSYRMTKTCTEVA